MKKLRLGSLCPEEEVELEDGVPDSKPAGVFPEDLPWPVPADHGSMGVVVLGF